jgi:hypothetical protein
VNTLTAGSSTEKRRPTLVASSQYASLHHPGSADSPEIETRQAMQYNVTPRHVRATIAAVEKQQVLHILSVCLWP